MFTYFQESGELKLDDEHVAFGYSGSPIGKNRPDMESVHNVGPIPRGMYTIGAPYDTKTHGPFVLPLEPDLDNQMYGRSGFLIHGDSVVHPGTASEGCIILARNIREMIANSGVDRLLVKA